MISFELVALGPVKFLLGVETVIIPDPVARDIPADTRRGECRAALPHDDIQRVSHARIDIRATNAVRCLKS